MKHHGKKFVEKKKLVNNEIKYLVGDAVKLLKQTAGKKFDETIDMAIHLGTDPKKTDQNVRGTVSLPGGTGKSIKLVVLTKGEKVKEAQDAGADFAGAEDLIEKISGGWIDFDLVLASPDIMAAVGKLGKVLGRKGLMPNPKAGTVTNDIGKAVKEFKAGKVEFKQDKTANLHVMVGKASFAEKSIEDNIMAVMETVSKAKPHGFKGHFIRSATVSTTMGPGIRLNVSKIIKEAAEA